MGGPAGGAKALDWIMKWVVLPIVGIIGAAVLFFLGYGIYAFFS